MNAGAKSVSAHVNVTVTNKPPRMELDGKKWMIEYQKNQTNLIVSDTEMRQNVYIFKCEGSTIQVKGALISRIHYFIYNKLLMRWLLNCVCQCFLIIPFIHWWF